MKDKIEYSYYGKYKNKKREVIFTNKADAMEMVSLVGKDLAHVSADLRNDKEVIQECKKQYQIKDRKLIRSF